MTANRAPLGLALATLLPFAALALWARLIALGPWELQLLAAMYLAPWPEGGVARLLVDATNTLGDLRAWLPLVLALAIGLALVGRAAAALLVALTPLADGVGFLVKLAVERERPEGALVEHILGFDSFAFPSGHVVRAVALAATLAWLLSPARLRLPAAVAVAGLVGLAMGYARVAAGVHWPSDVLGGLLLGLGWFALAAWLVQPRSPT